MAQFVMYVLRILLTGLISSALQSTYVSALNETARVPKPVTWARLVSADPYVADLMAYCRTMNLDRTGCAVKFLADTGPPQGIATKPPLTKRMVTFAASMFSSSSIAPPRLNGFVSSTVALKAAANCIRKQDLLNTHLSNIFKIDVLRMREVASGIIGLKSNPGWQQDKHGYWFRETYSIKARQRAADKAEKSFWDQIQAKRAADRKAENDIREEAVGVIFAKLEDDDAEKWIRLGESIADLIEYGIGKNDRATAAFDSPGLMDVAADIRCFVNQPNCFSLDTGEVVSPPEGPGANDYYAPPDKKEEPPKVEFEVPNSMDGHDFDRLPEIDHFIVIPRSEPVEPPKIVQVPPVSGKVIIDELGPKIDPEDTSDDEDAGIDESNSTPVLHDFDERTALQKCQEEQEQQIWHGIIITQKDPDAPTDEERKGAADQMLKLGVCDKTYYGASYCQAWKIEQDKVPVDPEQALALYDHAVRNPLCPINLMSPEDCAHRIDLIRGQLDCVQYFDTVLGEVWTAPGLPAGERLDFGGAGSGGPGRFVPLTQEEWLGNDWSAVGLAPVKPRIAGGKEAYEAIVAMNMKFPTGNSVLEAWIPAAGRVSKIK